MLNFMINTPVNSRGRIIEYVKERIRRLEQKVNEEIMVSSLHDYEAIYQVLKLWSKTPVYRIISFSQMEMIKVANGLK